MQQVQTIIAMINKAHNQCRHIQNTPLRFNIENELQEAVEELLVIDGTLDELLELREQLNEKNRKLSKQVDRVMLECSELKGITVDKV